jgi:nucleotide-binding universal stress UspA family protein
MKMLMCSDGSTSLSPEQNVSHGADSAILGANLEGRLIDEVIVPTDFSPAAASAVSYAMALAARVHANVRLVHVVEPTPFMSTLNAMPIVLPDEEVVQWAEKELANIAAAHPLPDSAVTFEVRVGNPREQIAAISPAKNSTVMVISTHGRTGLKHLLMGSVAESIVRHASCPVLVVRGIARGAVSPGPNEARFDRIVVPVDFSEASEAAVHYAARFSREFGGDLIAMHCVHYQTPLAGTESGAFDFTQLYDTLRASAAAKLDEVVRRNVPSGVDVRREIRVGPPRGEIPDFAVRVTADLIICTSHGRTGLSHVFLGSTAESVVRHAPCPVLVIPRRNLKLADDPST